jgi:hypothetical protein
MSLKKILERHRLNTIGEVGSQIQNEINSNDKELEHDKQTDDINISINDESTSFNLTEGPDNQIIKKRKKIKWTDKHIDILVDWADKAMCYRWLHSKNTDKYKKLNALFTVPVIIMSTLTGTANFAYERVPRDMQSYYSMIVGGVNILAGIVTTVQNFLKISELNESHRVASIAWDKIHRKIKLEIAKSPEERGDVDIFLKNCSEEFDRLTETSPDIDESVLKMFKSTFEGKISILQNIKDFFTHKIKVDDQGEIIPVSDKQKAFKNISKPPIYDSLESVRISVYKPPNQATVNTQTAQSDTCVANISVSPQTLVTHEASYKIKEILKLKKELDLKEKKMNEFCEDFFKLYSRYPTEEEIIDNLENEQEKITKTIITNWISKTKDKYKNNKYINYQQDKEQIIGDENV